MLGRYWRSPAAIGCGVALFLSATALAQQPKQPALKGQPVPEAGQQQRAQDTQQGPANKGQAGPDLLPAIKSIESGIREHIPKEDKEGSERKEQRDIADLEAQQTMAFWAKWMFWAAAAGLSLTSIGLALTSIGVYLLYHTLLYTRVAAEAAEASVVQARRAAEAAEATYGLVASVTRIENRAYISVIPAGVNELIGNQRAMGHVDVQNVGKRPARNVTVQVRMKIAERERGLHPRDEEFPIAQDIKEVIDRAIQPGARMRQGSAQADLIPVQRLLQEDDKYVYVWGAIFYDDGFERRFTRFRHRYPIVSHSFDHRDWKIPAQKTRVIIASDKARLEPFGNNVN